MKPLLSLIALSIAILTILQIPAWLVIAVYWVLVGVYWKKGGKK